MNVLSAYFNLGLGALFLQKETYENMRAEARPFVKGLILIALVGAIVAAFALVGTILEWSTAPDLVKVKAIVLDELQQMDWYQDLAGHPEASQSFHQIYDMVWQILQQTVWPNVPNAAINIILSPLSLIIQWLVFGCLAYIFARLLGGSGSLAQTLGCLALAVAPQMLGAVQIIPNAQVGGLFVWTLVCSYTGLKVSGQLSPWRAFWATILPLILLALLALVGGAIAMQVVASTVGGA